MKLTKPLRTEIMKKYLLLIICTLTNNFIKAQIPVTDVAAGAQLTALNTSALTANSTRSSTLAKTIATLKQITAMKQQYDKQMEMVEEVSGYVKTGKQMSNMKSYLSAITSEYSKGISYVGKEKMITPNEKDRFLSAYSAMMDESLEDFEYGLNIISDGSLKMNDAERLTILGDIETKMEKKKNLLTYFNTKIKRSVAIKTSENQKNQDINNAVKSLSKSRK